MAKHNEIGKIGENIAETFLMKQGFTIIERNFRVPYGEIDIIAEKDNNYHIIEVKSVNVDNVSDSNLLSIQPEDNFTYVKRKKLDRSIKMYLAGKGIFEEGKGIHLHLACVYINTEKREGRVKMIWNI